MHKNFIVTKESDMAACKDKWERDYEKAASGCADLKNNNGDDESSDIVGADYDACIADACIATAVLLAVSTAVVKRNTLFSQGACLESGPQSTKP